MCGKRQLQHAFVWKGNKEIKMVVPKWTNNFQFNRWQSNSRFSCLCIGARSLPELYQRAVKPCSWHGTHWPKTTRNIPRRRSQQSLNMRSHRRAEGDESHQPVLSNWNIWIMEGSSVSVCSVPRSLTLIPGCRRTVHAAGQVRCAGIHSGLTRRRLPQSSNPTRARACELAWEVQCEGSQSAVGVLGRVGAAPAWFLLDEGVVGRQWAVGRARMELGPLAAAERHAAATGSPWDGRQGRCRSQEGQVSDVWAHRDSGARLGQHRWRQVDTLRTTGEGIPGGDFQKSRPEVWLGPTITNIRGGETVKEPSFPMMSEVGWESLRAKVPSPCVSTTSDFPSSPDGSNSLQLIGQGEEQGEDDSPATLAWPAQARSGFWLMPHLHMEMSFPIPWFSLAYFESVKWN